MGKMLSLKMENVDPNFLARRPHISNYASG